MGNALVTCQAWEFQEDALSLHSREGQSESVSPKAHQPRLPRHSSQELQGFGPPVQEKTLDQGADVQLVKGCSAWDTSSHLGASISSFINCVSLFFETETCQSCSLSL